jgi:hypothetical protein
MKWFQVNLELMVAHMAMAAQNEREQNHNDDPEVAKTRWQRMKRGTIIGGAAATGGVLLFITGGKCDRLVVSICVIFIMLRL